MKIKTSLLLSIFLILCTIEKTCARTDAYYTSVNAVLKKINYYNVLNIKENATLEEVKKAFRTLALT